LATSGFERIEKLLIRSERRYTMQLKEIMTPNVEVIHPDATVQEAAQKMKGLDVGPLPVCDGERLVGMLTDRDITIRATAEGRDPKTTKAQDVMTCEVIYAFEDQGVTEAARLMEEHQIRRLLVLNRDKQLVGIVSLGDLAVHTGDERLAGEVVERVSEPADPSDRDTCTAVQ
jgi:CBS domain-containing protein